MSSAAISSQTEVTLKGSNLQSQNPTKSPYKKPKRPATPWAPRRKKEMLPMTYVTSVSPVIKASTRIAIDRAMNDTDEGLIERGSWELES